MPAHDRLRLDQTKVRSPGSRPNAAKPNLEDSVRSTEAGTRVGAQGDLELMAEDQVVQHEVEA